ncbi:MAG: molybdopterin oxidoreductase family protein [Alphaproteobacteria bacterium]|nr:molybdopterin oxidoreductase family protein [Alphaproteobacteria bacterium]
MTDTAPELHFSACPHDCPSTCALEVEKLAPDRIGRVRGAEENSYTAGVICAKVARYAERVHHPDRLLFPLRRTGPKGSRQFTRIGWDEALDRTAEAFLARERQHGAETIWPYYFAGTMGQVMFYGIERLRHAKRYSNWYTTICVNPAWLGFEAGTGKLMGSDPREMAKADCVVIWGTNAVNTQVNVMHHATKARKERGAKIVVVDVYRNTTAQQADMFLCVRPGTDGALACAVMHVLFRDNLADRDFLARCTDAPAELEAHLKTRTPAWASAITGLSIAEIEAFAHLVGRTKRTFFRLGFGFTRSRNGAVNMHAALSISAVTGCWRYEGGGAFKNNEAIYTWNRTLLEGLDVRDTSVRSLDQSRIGAILCGEREALRNGPPVTGLLIQNTNPMCVAPDLNMVRRGFARDDLFTCVHEQFMTDTAAMADIVLPATAFLEHDDIYSGGGHQHVMFGPKIIEPPGECRTNHDVINDLAKRVGAKHPGFEMTAWELIDHTLKASGYPDAATLKAKRWIEVQPDFETAHYVKGFAHPDGKFHFKPDWKQYVPRAMGLADAPPDMPTLPDHWDVIERATDEMPFRLVTAPARNTLNSSFTETPTSQAREGRPRAKMHPADAALLGVADGDRVRLGNRRGTVVVLAEHFEGLQRGVVIVEGVMPGGAFEDGLNTNVLTGADTVAPIGGAAFHDNAIWLRRADAPAAQPKETSSDVADRSPQGSSHRRKLVPAS